MLQLTLMVLKYLLKSPVRKLLQLLGPILCSINHHQRICGRQMIHSLWKTYHYPPSFSPMLLKVWLNRYTLKKYKRKEIVKSNNLTEKLLLLNTCLPSFGVGGDIIKEEWDVIILLLEVTW